jgi:ribosomal protein S27AE
MKNRGKLLRDYPFPEPELEGKLSPSGPVPEWTPGPSRPRTATLRGLPLPLLRPPSCPPPIETSVGEIATDPEEEITEVLVKQRAECLSCGYLARHVKTFPDGLCGLCRTTIGMTV